MGDLKKQTLLLWAFDSTHSHSELCHVDHNFLFAFWAIKWEINQYRMRIDLRAGFSSTDWTTNPQSYLILHKSPRGIFLLCIWCLAKMVMPMLTQLFVTGLDGYIIIDKLLVISLLNGAHRLVRQYNAGGGPFFGILCHHIGNKCFRSVFNLFLKIAHLCFPPI